LSLLLEVDKEDVVSVTIQVQGATATITLSGNIDYSLQEEIRTANQQALSNEQIQEICVDFKEVTFLDSSVIRALLTLQKQADAAGKSLVLLNCNNNTREVFEIGGFDRMFTFRLVNARNSACGEEQVWKSVLQKNTLIILSHRSPWTSHATASKRKRQRWSRACSGA
jgi:anti-anti-sigma factor